jgi:hypothetical protein
LKKKMFITGRGSLLGERKSLLKASGASRPESGAATLASSSLSSPAPTSFDHRGGGTAAAADVTLRLEPGFDQDLELYHVPDEAIFRSYPPDVTFRPFEDVLPDLKPRPPVGYILAQEDASECDVVSRRYSSIPVCWGPGGLLLHCGAVPGNDQALYYYFFLNLVPGVALHPLKTLFFFFLRM